MCVSTTCEDLPADAAGQAGIRPAWGPDVPALLSLLGPGVADGRFLPRRPATVVDRLRDFLVLGDADGTLIGVVSLSLSDLGVAEIGVLEAATEVDEDSLVDAVLAECRRMGAHTVFTISRSPAPFVRAGFRAGRIDAVPAKRDRQCLRCTRLPTCRQPVWLREL